MVTFGFVWSFLGCETSWHNDWTHGCWERQYQSVVWPWAKPEGGIRECRFSVDGTPPAIVSSCILIVPLTHLSVLSFNFYSEPQALLPGSAKPLFLSSLSQRLHLQGCPRMDTFFRKWVCKAHCVHSLIAVSFCAHFYGCSFKKHQKLLYFAVDGQTALSYLLG